MKSRANAAAAVAALLLGCFARSLGGAAIAHENGEILANASMADSAVREIFDDLVKESDVSTFVESSASEYFSLLDANFGNNMFGTCGFVAAGMLLSFYDQDVDSEFISDEYTVYSSGSSGILFESSSLYSGLKPAGYLDRILSDGPASFQEELISTYEREVGAVKLDSGGISGLSAENIGTLIEAYLSGRDGISGEYAVSVDSTSTDMRDDAIKDILDGTPSILIVSDPSSGDAHAVIAYDYDSEKDEIYVHTGWRDEETGKALTHVSLSSIGYSSIDASIRFEQHIPNNTSGIYTAKISPADYGFADAYPTDEYHRNTYIDCEVDGLTFRTRRYRTGYIQGEYIVMSPIRKGINEAFIEYEFDADIIALDVQLSHWRNRTNEWLDASNGSAIFEVYMGGEWITQLDLLSDTTALPTDRTNPKTYRFSFERPIHRMRFRAEYYETGYADLNRGRICIGDIDLKIQGGILPLSGWEPDYEPAIWNREDIVGSINCYTYALNDINLGWTFPGFTEYTSHTQIKDYFDKAVMEEMMMLDAENLGIDISPIGKYERCDRGFYKIAFVMDPGRDFHFYRQNPDGTWSHKLGMTPVTNRDYDGNIIRDPETCNRDYWQNGHNADMGYFKQFVGFYQVEAAFEAR